jgi:very-short-patch-repair endonuclease
MSSRREKVRALLSAAEDLHGLVALRSADEFGFTKKEFDAVASSALLEWFVPGVYRVAGAPRSLPQAYLASVLSIGGEALLSGFAAAHHLRISGTVPRSIEIKIPYGGTARASKLRAPGQHPFSTIPMKMSRTLRLDLIDRVVADSVPCTTAARTLIDVASRVNGDQLESMFENARRLGLVSAEHLSNRIAILGGKGMPGCAKIRELLTRQIGVAPNDSELETRLWQLLRLRTFAIGDEPTRQLLTERADGEVARIDVGWRRLLYGVEAEGWEWHQGRIRWKRDKRRTASLEAAGWRLTFVTWDDVVNHPNETLARIETAYRERKALLR